MVMTKDDYEHFKNFCQKEFIVLIRRIADKKNWDVDNLIELFSNGFVIGSNINHKCCSEKLCCAMVPNGDDYRRCTRKKKYGGLCGLHYNMELRSGSAIQKYSINKNISNNVTNTFFINNNYFESTCTSTRIVNDTKSIEYKSENTTILNYSVIDSDTDDNNWLSDGETEKSEEEDNWETILWGHRELLLHTKTNIVYNQMVEGKAIIGKYDSEINQIIDCY